MATGFKRGDVVRLKSDGPHMTVTEVSGSDGEVTCQWFSKSGVLQTNIFERILLEQVVSPQQNVSALSELVKVARKMRDTPPASSPPDKSDN